MFSGGLPLYLGAGDNRPYATGMRVNLANANCGSKQKTTCLRWLQGKHARKWHARRYYTLARAPIAFFN